MGKLTEDFKDASAHERFSIMLLERLEGLEAQHAHKVDLQSELDKTNKDIQSLQTTLEGLADLGLSLEGLRDLIDVFTGYLSASKLLQVAVMAREAHETSQACMAASGLMLGLALLVLLSTFMPFRSR
jgi:hypothetical protein